MKKSLKRIISVILVSLMLASISIPAIAAEPVDYAISNPYVSVDFDTWHYFKANTHSHTLFSDGTLSVTDVVNEYYKQDYDILAITDHGEINKGWTVKPKLIPILSYNQYTQPLNPMSSERYAEVTSGAGRDGRAMLDVDRGIELNAGVIRKNHINSFFSDYGNGYLGIEGDYETSLKGVEEAGGVCYINHPGDFIVSSKDVKIATDPANVKFFGDIILKYDALLGMEVYNRVDSVTRNDRILWDSVLQYTIPRGKVYWGFAGDDSHKFDDIGVTSSFYFLPELSNDALRASMESGAFFVASKRDKNVLGDDFVGTGDYPVINRVTVDDQNDTITINAENYDSISWIADGNIISTDATINLRDYSDKISCYVRAQLINDEGGIILSQPFVCDDGTMADGIDPDDWKQPLSFEQLWQKLIYMIMNIKLIVLIKELLG